MHVLFDNLQGSMHVLFDNLQPAPRLPGGRIAWTDNLRLKIATAVEAIDVGELNFDVDSIDLASGFIGIEPMLQVICPWHEAHCIGDTIHNKSCLVYAYLFNLACVTDALMLLPCRFLFWR